MTRARPRLSARTTSLLYHLQRLGAGGADAGTLAKRARLDSPRSAAARLRWLQRGGLVRYVADTECWQLTDDSMFAKEKT